MSNRWKLAIAGAVERGRRGGRRDHAVRRGRASRPTPRRDPTTTRADDPTGDGDSAGERTITVSGHGTVSVVPDTADLMAGVQAQARDGDRGAGHGRHEVAGADRHARRAPASPPRTSRRPASACTRPTATTARTSPATRRRPT